MTLCEKVFPKEYLQYLGGVNTGIKNTEDRITEHSVTGSFD